MKKQRFILLLLLLLFSSSLAFAAVNGRYALDWWTVDGGGGVSSNGRYTLQATIGQPDAGEMSNGRYALFTGYWDGAAEYDVYLPVVIRP